MAAIRKPALASGLLAKPGSAPARSVAIEDLPRVSVQAATMSESGGGGLKASTVGTTLYLLPSESKRLRKLAIDLDLSLHEMMLNGLDRILAEHGQQPVRRYVPTLVKEKKR